MVIGTEQAPPDARVQVEETNVTLPLPPDCENVIVSPVTGAVKTVRVAVHCEFAPTLKLVGTQETAKVSAWRVRVSVPTLAALLGSPG